MLSIFVYVFAFIVVLVVGFSLAHFTADLFDAANKKFMEKKDEQSDR